MAIDYISKDGIIKIKGLEGLQKKLFRFGEQVVYSITNGGPQGSVCAKDDLVRTVLDYGIGIRNIFAPDTCLFFFCLDPVESVFRGKKIINRYLWFTVRIRPPPWKYDGNGRWNRLQTGRRQSTCGLASAPKG